MATGDPVGQVLQVMPLATSGAYPVVLAGASTPAERYTGWAFEDAASAYLDLKVCLAGYDGGGLTVRLQWRTTVTTNNCVWQAAFRAIPDDTEDIDTTAHTYQFNTVTAAAPSAAGELSYDNITFTDGADMDSFANNEQGILRILRDPGNASDSLAATAVLCGVFITET